MSNKTVLITGGSTGIGYELAKIFNKEGYNLIRFTPMSIILKITKWLNS